MASLQPPPWGPSATGEEQAFLQWIMADEAAAAAAAAALKPPPVSAASFLSDGADDNAAAAVGFDFGLVDSAAYFSPESLPLPLPPAMLLQESLEGRSAPPPPTAPQTPFPTATAPQSILHTKQQQHSNSVANQTSIFMPLPSSFASHHQNPLSPLLQPEPLIVPPSLRRNQSSHFSCSSHSGELFPLPAPLPKSKNSNGGGDQQQQLLLDQLFDAARIFEAGNLLGTREILARLNHGLVPSGKPHLRTAFYFKEALVNLIDNNNGNARALPASSPIAVALKIGAYKAFAEFSPIPQFANFTATQTLLDELADAHRIHVLDFDIGVGGQWASFMQELVHRRDIAADNIIPTLKVSAFVPLMAVHPLEMQLIRDNLSQFAAALGIQFEFNTVSLDSFESRDVLISDEVVAVNLPVGACAGTMDMPLPAILRLIRPLTPKVVIATDHGGDHSDLSFAQHFVHSFQYCMSILDSVESAGADAETMSRIEHFLIQPRIDNTIQDCSRRASNETMPSWQSLFMSAGFMPVQLSNFAEAQADCLVKRVQVRGFRSEKRHASLTLYWQRNELVSVSAWRC